MVEYYGIIVKYRGNNKITANIYAMLFDAALNRWYPDLEVYFLNLSLMFGYQHS